MADQKSVILKQIGIGGDNTKLHEVHKLRSIRRDGPFVHSLQIEIYEGNQS